jgi:hypothetical protein
MGKVDSTSYQQLLDVSVFILSRSCLSTLDTVPLFLKLFFSLDLSTEQLNSDEGLKYQEKLFLNGFENETNIERSYLTENKVDPLHTFNYDDGTSSIDHTAGPFLPRWQTSPVLQSSLTNENLFAEEPFAKPSRHCVAEGALVIGGFVIAPRGSSSHTNMNTAVLATLQSIAAGTQVDYEGDPVSYLAIPIFDTFDVNTRQVVAVIKSTIHWRSYLVNLLPSNVNGVTVVLENECDGFFTYEIQGKVANVVGSGDQHQTQFDDYGMTGRFTIETIEDGTIQGLQLNQDGCPYFIHVYPTQIYYESFQGNDSWIVAVSLAVVFAFTICVFIVYDCLVEKRQSVVLKHATQSTAIVSSLFVSFMLVVVALSQPCLLQQNRIAQLTNSHSRFDFVRVRSVWRIAAEKSP